MASRIIRALVTAGGTREPIDDVRVLTNISGGRFGVAIARALVAAGIETTLVGSREALAKLGPTDAAIHRVPFTSFRDLDETLAAAAANPFRPDLVLMAAAVADYSPVPIDGKLRSSADELVIRCRRNAKLIARFREQFGIAAFLVGFKLSSRMSRAARIDAAREQLHHHRLNCTVANDLADLRTGQHPVILVTPESGAVTIDGTRDDVAAALVTCILRRMRVQWSRSEAIPETSTIDHGAETRQAIRRRAGDLLSVAQRANLLPGTEGNVSYRAAGLGFWVTPRRVSKATLTAEDLVFVEPDLPHRIIRYRGTRKPSIDSIVQAMLYAHFPDLKGFLHFHDGVVVTDMTTSFPYPCGTIEEAEEIIRTVGCAAAERRYHGGPFAVRLIHHGHLIGIEPGGAERLAREWGAAERAYRTHLATVLRNGERTPITLKPIFASARIVGVLARFTALHATSCFILPEHRAHEYGDAVIRQLDARGETIVAHDDCRVLEYYLLRGYRLLRRDGALAYLEPPSCRTDIRAAATICCWHPATESVLIGRRGTPPFEGYYAFPGGGIADGEPPLDAALRELREETGIALQGVQPVRQTAYAVGAPDGTAVHRVTNVIVPLDEQPVPMPSAELEARWITIAEAIALRPIVTHATGSILRALAALQAARAPTQ